MTKQVSLTATTRSGNGKSEARKLRAQGRVPGIAYGRGVDPTAVSVDALELYHALHTDAGANAVLRLDIGGDTHLAMAREIQRHPVRRDVLHVDFVTMSRDQRVSVDVPVVVAGEAAGAQEGGVLAQEHHTISVETTPLEVPDQFTLDVSDMQIGDVKRAGDIRLPEGVILLVDADTAIVSVTAPTLEEIALPEEETEESAEAKAEGATGEEADVAEAEGQAEVARD